MRGMYLGVGLALALAACGSPDPGAGPSEAVSTPDDGVARSRSDFNRVVARLEPAAEQYCREVSPGAPNKYCDFVFQFDADLERTPNAYQSYSIAGRPLVVMNARMLGQLRTDDEVALVLAHESAHHLHQYLFETIRATYYEAGLGSQWSDEDERFSLTSDELESLETVSKSPQILAFKRAFELDADRVGAFIAARAGYDPETGAELLSRAVFRFNDRFADQTTHPSASQRQEVLRIASAEIHRQQAAGITPRP